jgi:hypothetical protein
MPSRPATTPPFHALEFGSFLVYPSPIRTREHQAIQSFFLGLKRDTHTRQGSITQLAITRLAARAPLSPLSGLLNGSAVLVPTPGASPPVKNRIECARTLCCHMLSAGLGISILDTLHRVHPLRKSAFCSADTRPTPLEHYRTLAVRHVMPLPFDEPPRRILLVDDIVTKGATFAGAAARLREAFPAAQIRAFALARTTNEMREWIEPCLGRIDCAPDGSISTRVGC